MDSLTTYGKILAEQANIVLLEDTLSPPEQAQRMLFCHPIHILSIWQHTDFPQLLKDIEHYTQQGFYVAGYFGYECGYTLEKMPQPSIQSQQPLAWFGVYDTPITLPATEELSSVAEETTYALVDLHFDCSETDFAQKIERIKEYIRAGDVYQINFTGRYHFTFNGSPLAFYRSLQEKQRTHYSAFIRTAHHHVLCLSPELFFSVEGQQITTRPMKGTVARGCTLVEDQKQQEWLQQDSKNRAENVMIVDLLRNDVGRICEVGSVTVPELFTIERYDTVHQMTSTVTGRLRESSYADIVTSLFPCGSITGAPKLRAMQIIEELESSPRGVYTGAIGYFSPQHETQQRKAVFNVAIRTIVLDQEGRGEMGVGSGIVIDSQAQDEYTECLLKAQFLTAPAVQFELLESILWADGYQQLSKHLERMGKSACYFNWPFPQQRTEAILLAQSQHFLPGARYKVRLLLSKSGEISCEAEALPALSNTPSLTTSDALPIVALSSQRTSSQDLFYYHKTTHRPLYMQASKDARTHGYADMLFTNERGELTEGAISNIIIEKNGMLYTPPQACGLLDGIYRQHLLETNPLLQEKILYPEDLLSADAIYICNSIRGLRQVRLA